VEEISLPKSEIQLDSVELAVITAIVFAMSFIFSIVMMTNRRSQKKQMGEGIPVELEDSLPVSS
jgi:hypothetical protein